MKTIFKYELEIKDKQTLELPLDHRILSVQNQNGKLCLWAAVESEDTFKTNRTFRVFGTGNTDDDLEFYFGGDMEYISTVQLQFLVLHIFVEI